MVYTQPGIPPGERDTQKTSLGFWDTNWSPNIGQTVWPGVNKLNNNRTENLLSSGLNCPSKPLSKTESEKRYKYQDLATELKKD